MSKFVKVIVNGAHPPIVFIYLKGKPAKVIELTVIAMVMGESSGEETQALSGQLRAFLCIDATVL